MKKTCIVSETETRHPEGDEDCDAPEVTEEEREQLGRMMDECHRTGATPLMDALLADKDWPEEELLGIYRDEVERRLSRAGQHPGLGSASDVFFDHVQTCFRVGNSEEQCATKWITRLS